MDRPLVNGEGTLNRQTVQRWDDMGNRMNQHSELQEWVEQMAARCQPDDIVWIDGSDGNATVSSPRLPRAGRSSY